MGDCVISHASFDDLRKKCDVDTSSTLRKLKSQTSIKCLKFMDELYKKSQELQSENKLESAYTALRRCLDIGGKIMENSDYLAFKRTSDAAHFHGILTRVMSEINIVEERLRVLYTVKNVEKANATQKIIQNKKQERKANNELDSTFINPKKLIDLVERGNVSVLIIDYRSEKPHLLHFVKSKYANNIYVVLLNPLEIPNGCILSMLATTVDVSDRQNLLNAAHYDFVVLVGDKNEVRLRIDEMPRDCATKKLIAALTTYNNSRASLKHTPLILQDGFDTWYFTYPTYTRPASEEQEELSFEAKFGRMLIEASKVSSVNVTYPHLLPTVAAPTDVKPKSRPAARSDSNSATQWRPSVSAFSSDGVRSTVSNEAPSVSPAQRPKVPSVDRSTKPSSSMVVSSSSHIADNGRPPTVLERRTPDAITQGDVTTFPSSPAMPPQSCAQTALRMSAGGSEPTQRRDLPLVPTLGGARLANANLAPSVQHQPPMPDRSTKSVRDYSKDDLKYFNEIYDASIKDINERSKPGSTHPGYTGLYNMQNTCFMNTTLQALFNTPGFAPLFMDKQICPYINIFNKYGTRGVISGAFSALMDSVWSGRFVAIRPTMFLDMFVRFVNSSLGDRRQHDAQEFQIYLLDALHEDTNKINERKPFEQNYKGINLARDAEDYIAKARLFSSSVIGDFFNLRMVSRLSCTACQTTSATFEEMNQISLELPSTSQQRSTTLQESLQRHFEDILLEGWNCPSCKSPRLAGRSTRVWTLPSVLIVHMKRFSFDGGQFVKNEIDVNYDVEHLSLASFVHEQAPRQNTNYSLYAVTNHSGRLNSGHYTAFVRNFQTMEWLRFDDDCVSVTNPSSVKSRNAFILYYTNRTN